MLKTIDILLALTVVMLVASMVVTVLTQFVTSIGNTRGRHLLQGLADLLQQIDPQIERKIAESVCGAVLSHPMIRDVGQRYGAAIHREEFTKLLMDLASGQAPANCLEKLGAETRQTLLKTLQDNGIEDPKATVERVRDMALQLELDKPELATCARQAQALMQEANSKLLAKINSWFDQTIDRVSDRFTFTTRGITFICSVAVALLFQIDTVTLINRLSVDDQLRNTLVEQAYRKAGEQPPSDPVSAALTEKQKDELRELLELDVLTIPGSVDDWYKNWKNANAMGLVLSVFLMSLGAPFWYGALKNLLKLRGTLAGKDDSQRSERQNSQVGALPAGSVGQ